MKITRTHILWSVAALGLLALASYWATRPKAVNLVQTSTADMVQSIVTTGRVAMSTRSDVTSTQSLRVEAVLVNEGDAVQAGQVLVRLRSQEAQAAATQAQAAVQEAQLRFSQVHSVQAVVSEQQLEQAKATDRLAQQELERARALVAQGFVSPSRLNEADRAAQSSQAAVKAALAQAQSTRGNGLEEQLARSKLAQAQANWQASQERLTQTDLKAPVAGRVIKRSVEVGDVATPARTLMTIVSAGATQLHATVDEKNIKSLRVGQTALANADANPQTRFKAQVLSIAPSIDPLRGTVEVKLEVEPGAAAALQPDMTVSIEIIVATAQQAVRAPTQALVMPQDGAPFVWRVTDGRARRTPVTLGLQGLGSTQILSGLAAGDTLVVPESALVLNEGDKVRGKVPVVSKALGTMPMPGLSN